MSLPPLPAAPAYWPLEDGPFRLKLGLKPLDLADWVQIDEAYPRELALKRRLLDEQPDDVLAATDASDAACRELLDVLVEHLCRRFPDWFSASGNELHNRLTDERWPLDDRTTDSGSPWRTLRIAAQLVQEDLCLLQTDEEETNRLTAACVCFPSRWRLADKFQRTVAEVHGPVAHYDEQIGPAVDRLFAALTPDRPLFRFNWNVHESDELFQPTGMGTTAPDPTITAENVPQRLWFRVERQTLRRLPATGATVFTIRTYLRPLGKLATQPAAAARLAAALRAMPADTFGYKSLPVFADAALEWLDSVAVQRP